MSNLLIDYIASKNGLNIVSSAPTSPTSTGSTGDIVWDSDYIYICTATNTWKRLSIATWSTSSVPSQVTGLSVTSTGDGTIDLSWTAPSSDETITDYSVEYTPSGGSASTVLVGSAATTYQLTGLTNGTEYTIRVAAISSVGTGSYSSSVAGTLAASLTTLTLTDVSATPDCTESASWDPSELPADTYYIIATITGIVTGGSSASTWTLTAYEPGTPIQADWDNDFSFYYGEGGNAGYNIYSRYVGTSSPPYFQFYGQFDRGLPDATLTVVGYDNTDTPVASGSLTGLTADTCDDD